MFGPGGEEWFTALLRQDQLPLELRRRFIAIELSTTMFETLSRILSLPDRECQRAALHGLGHLRHRDTSRVVADYLARNASLPDNVVEYACRVRDGQRIL